MSNPFKKFIQTEESGSKKKERIRQEKKKVRKETQEFFEKKKEEARMARAQGGVRPSRHKGTERQDSREKRQGTGYKAQGGRSRTEDTRQKAQGSGYKSQGSRDKVQGTGYKAQGGKSRTEDTRQKAEGSGYKSQGPRGKVQGAGYKAQGGRGRTEDTRQRGTKPQSQHDSEATSYKRTEKTYKASNSPSAKGHREEASHKPQAAKKSFSIEKKQDPGKVQKAAAQPQATDSKPQTGSMPLNKFIAHSGICSRRDAAEMVKSGKITVNDKQITEPGHKVTDKDDIKINGKRLQLRRNLVYILLNKPKDFITTTEDPQGRKTVMDIVRNATPERVYPIGRLDRNTTGVLLLTNDGELAQKLSHPSYEIKKIYEVKLDKPLVKKDFETLINGVTLEDGFIAPDTVAYADPKDKSIIGIEIHSGRNRIVRRIFEHLGYDVRNLDRVMYANLTKKNVDRGKWRFLSEKEVRLLKYLNASYTKNKPAARG